jgi:hypothetical protein
VQPLRGVAVAIAIAAFYAVAVSAQKPLVDRVVRPVTGDSNLPQVARAGILGANLAGLAPTTPLSSDGAFQVLDPGHLDVGDSVVNITNAGTLNGFDPVGRICANVYVFDPNEEMVSCCSCMITPNGLNSLSVRNDLISNTLTPGVPTAVVIKLLASTPVGATCDASSPNAANLVRGMRAWGTNLHALPTTPVTYGVTEYPFSIAELSPTELSKLTSFCGFIQSNGSGFGICKSCRFGALGADLR